jgi:hypothetical protein
MVVLKPQRFGSSFYFLLLVEGELIKFRVLTTTSIKKIPFGMLRRVVWKKFTDVSEVITSPSWGVASETSANFCHITPSNIPEDGSSSSNN